MLAGFEGKTAATWGLAYAVGMVLGGRVFATGITRASLRAVRIIKSAMRDLLGPNSCSACDGTGNAMHRATRQRTARSTTAAPASKSLACSARLRTSLRSHDTRIPSARPQTCMEIN